MRDIEADLRQSFTSRLDPIHPGPLPTQVRSRARRGRALMLALATLTSVALVGGTVIAVSSLTGQRNDGGPIEPAISPRPIVPLSNGRIAYSATGQGSVELRTVRPDGSDQRVIPTPDGDPWSHSWSRDGSELAVVLFSAEGGPRTIWVMNPDGSDPRQVASAGHLTTPSWSPDGRTLAYAATTGRRTSIHLVDAKGRNDRIVHAEGTEGTFSIFSVAFSPDGTQLLFDRGTDSGFNIFVMDVDGTDLTQLTTGGKDYNPSWSPDGTRIAFTREDDGKADANTVVTSDIFVMNADGSGIQRLTETQPGSTDRDPVWAPDGSKIAYAAGRTGGPGRVIVMNPDGSDPVELVDQEVLGLSWQPQPAMNSDDVRVEVPDLLGLTFRQACEMTEGKLMLRVENYGRMESCDEKSVVATQRPDPGTWVSPGSRLIITLTPRKL